MAVATLWSMMDPIPLVDLRAQFRAIQQEIQEAIDDTLRTQSFIMGDAVRVFEEDFAAYCTASHAIACSSGTTALHLALIVSGVKRGDEVISSPSTFIGTTEPIMHCGANVVFADIDPETCCLDPKRVRDAITEKTRAVLAVNLYGRPADYDGLREVIADRPITLIEDAAQSHGARRDGRCSGVLADLACFSFYPGKNLGAYGDAGCVVTDDARRAEQLHLLVNHGRKNKYEHLVEGYNYRMDAIQARILSVKLRHLEAWTRQRIHLADRYHRMLHDAGLLLPKVEPDVRHVYHLYVVQADKRDGLLRRMREKGIQAGVHYPVPLHLQPAYGHMGHREGDFPTAEALSRRCVSLPLYPEMRERQVDYICEVIRDAVSA